MSLVIEIQLINYVHVYLLDWRQCFGQIAVPPNHWRGGDHITGGNQAGKLERSLFDCITVTDGIKIIGQNNPIAKGPLYLHNPI